MPRPKQCLACKGVFHVKPSHFQIYKFCSSVCRSKFRKTGKRKKCPVCQTKFYVKRSHLKTKYLCSRKCQGKFYEDKFTGKLNPNYRGTLKKTCLRCKKNYSSYNTKRQYCSRKCVFPSKKPKKCDRCGKLYYSQGRRFCSKVCSETLKKKNLCLICDKQAKKGRKYCDGCWYKKAAIITACPSCKKERKYWTRKVIKQQYCSKCRSRTGKNNPNYKDGRKPLAKMIRDCAKNRELIKEVLSEGKFCCKLCGQVGGKLEVDHKIKFAVILENFLNLYASQPKDVLFLKALSFQPFWDKTNLQVLCKKCNWNKEIEYRKSLKKK